MSAVPGGQVLASALGYAIYQNGALVLEMPDSLTRATIGMLKPGTSSISFEVKTVLSSGGGGAFKSISASTKNLPSGNSISNVSYKKNGNTVIYIADVLVPYAFVRLFIGGPHKPIGASAGWPIDAGLSTENGGGDAVAQYSLVNYLVEGNDFYSGFYKYTGAYIEGGSGNADWTWSPQGTAPQSQSGYTYTWNVPLGDTDALPDNYVVQGQGYAPIQNVFGGPLRSYKCAGESRGQEISSGVAHYRNLRNGGNFGQRSHKYVDVSSGSFTTWEQTGQVTFRNGTRFQRSLINDAQAKANFTLVGVADNGFVAFWMYKDTGAELYEIDGWKCQAIHCDF
ncbi:hypothetical protein IFR04_004098 [Cadophora malorum]|uniref:Uncharacterized protein n=1 Tax=Cadophora malorum TaxID=108018 RepID=A0A8H8BSL7_9HELO|nr:hypothetical protein IFR04_004098 [Cadophora malorum]